MSRLWPTKKLEELAEFQNGLWKGKKDPLVTAEVLRNTNFKNNDGSLNYDDVAEIEVEEKQLKKRTLSKGDIVLERSGGGPTQPVGRVVYFEGENDRFGFSNFTTRIRVNEENIDSKYLWFFLHSFYKSGKTELMQKKTTGIRNLTFPEYKQIDIPLPPLEVQKKIVAKLESLLAKIGEAKKLRAHARENVDNLLSAELHKIFEEGKKKGWEEKELGDVITLKSGTTIPKEWEGLEGELPYIKVSGMNIPTNNLFIKMSDKYVFRRPEVERMIVPPNSVIFPKRGGAITTNKKRIVDRSILVDLNIMAVICPPQLLDAKFFYYWFLLIDLASLNTGSSVPQINNGQIVPLIFPLPSLSEQKQIVKRLNDLSQKIDAARDLQDTTENEFSALEQSILHQAFEREL